MKFSSAKIYPSSAMLFVLFSMISFPAASDNISASIISAVPDSSLQNVYTITYRLNSIKYVEIPQTNWTAGVVLHASDCFLCSGIWGGGIGATLQNTDPKMTVSKFNKLFRQEFVGEIYTARISVRTVYSICTAIGSNRDRLRTRECVQFDVTKPPKPTVCNISIPNNVLDHGTISIGLTPAPVSTNVQISCSGGKGGYSVSIQDPSSNGDLNMGNVKSTLSLDGTVMRVSGAGKSYPNGGSRTIVLSSSLNVGTAAPALYRASATVVMTLI